MSAHMPECECQHLPGEGWLRNAECPLHGCPGDPWGGMERIESAMRELDRAEPGQDGKE
jgi:hypothetical protein